MDYKAEAGFEERVEIKSLAAFFAKVTDQRKRRGMRYQLAPLLVLIVLAKLCGSDKPFEIADWVSERAEKLKQALGLSWKRMPHHSTYRRILADGLKVEELEKQAREFIASLAVKEDEPKQEEGGKDEAAPGSEKVEAVKIEDVRAIDGKTLRGTISTEQTQGAHLLSIYQGSRCATLAQIAVASKENEISAAPRLIEQADVRGKTVTGDAMLAQKTLSRQIVEAGGDYLWIIKDNHPTLREEIETYFTAARLPAFAAREDFRAYTALDKGHGRIEQRTLTASVSLNDYLEWPYLEQVFEIKRETIICNTGQIRNETVYGITSHSVDRADAKTLLEINRAHWGIENGSHYRRDVTFGEDRCRMKSKTAAQALSVFNNLAIGLICHAGWRNTAQARRHYDAKIGKALRLILGNPG
jgi:predicted transposase YbfD/YdcC